MSEVRKAASTAARIMYELSSHRNFNSWVRDSAGAGSVISTEGELCEVTAMIADKVEAHVEEWDGEWMEVCEKISDLMMAYETLYEIQPNKIVNEVVPMILIPRQKKS